MSDKQRFTFLLRPDERAVLRRLARTVDRSEGATLRLLIRRVGKEFGLTTDGLSSSHNNPRVQGTPKGDDQD